MRSSAIGEGAEVLGIFSRTVSNGALWLLLLVWMIGYSLLPIEGQR